MYYFISIITAFRSRSHIIRIFSLEFIKLLARQYKYCISLGSVQYTQIQSWWILLTFNQKVIINILHMEGKPQSRDDWENCHEKSIENLHRRVSLGMNWSWCKCIRSQVSSISPRRKATGLLVSGPKFSPDEGKFCIWFKSQGLRVWMISGESNVCQMSMKFRNFMTCSP